MVQSQNIDAAKKGVISENTNRATDWAVCTVNFHTLCWYRNEQLPDNICSDEILQLLSNKNSSLCHWLCVVCNEARKNDGRPYTPRTITQLISGIQCYIHNHKPITILDTQQRSCFLVTASYSLHVPYFVHWVHKELGQHVIRQQHYHRNMRGSFGHQVW